MTCVREASLAGSSTPLPSPGPTNFTDQRSPSCRTRAWSARTRQTRRLRTSRSRNTAARSAGRSSAIACIFSGLSTCRIARRRPRRSPPRTQTNTAKAKWTSALGGNNSNELLLGYQRIRDKRALPNAVPLIFVGGDRGGTNIAAGAERFSQGNSLDQDIYEVTDNFTFSKGTHLLTVGTHNEFFHFFNVFFPASLGVWSFADTAALRAGT